ncbi:MAG: 1-(5-phosphoribosyl)-5-amino-4-imidazole-carboxylate carboxylase, partial [Proteobacteria bacterium]|nr:1-(5-phosphoribosyl)-5-amino-4-imidazole-carboxylate carboxylase [Pseudomonadota bacterium]
MDRARLFEMLQRIASGDLSPEKGLSELSAFPSANMGDAHLDTHRYLRRGIPETVFGQGKTPEQIEGIVGRLQEVGSPVLVTRITEEAADRLLSRWPSADHDPSSRTVLL